MSTARLRRYFMRARSAAAFTVPEVMVAAAVGSAAVAGTMMINTSQFMIIKSTRQTNAASLSLEERVEQLRIANWRQISDPNYLVNTFFSTKPKSMAPLDNFTERLTVSAWPNPTATEKLVVEEKAGSAAQMISAGSGLASRKLARADFSITWSGAGRVRSREFSTVISNAGLSRQNLPAFGAGYSGNGNSGNGGK